MNKNLNNASNTNNNISLVPDRDPYASPKEMENAWGPITNGNEPPPYFRKGERAPREIIGPKYLDNVNNNPRSQSWFNQMGRLMQIAERWNKKEPYYDSKVTYFLDANLNVNLRNNVINRARTIALSSGTKSSLVLRVRIGNVRQQTGFNSAYFLTRNYVRK